MREISAGDLDKKLDIRTGDEIEHPAVCFNAMTDELKLQMKNLTRVTAGKERIATELNVATKIILVITIVNVLGVWAFRRRYSWRSRKRS